MARHPEAAAFGAPAMLDLLLARGADLHARNVMGQDILSYAAGQARGDPRSCVENVTLLVRRGAAVDARDHDGRTVLHWASQAACAKALLAAGADVNARSHDGSTALLAAAGRGDLAMVEVLLAAGADPSLARSEPAGPLAPLAAAEKYGHPDVAALLRARGRRSAGGAPRDSLANRGPGGDRRKPGNEDCQAAVMPCRS